MKNKGLIIGSVALVGVVATLVFVKKKVKVVPPGSIIDKYSKKHPKSKLTTGEVKVPLYVWLFSKKK